MPWVDLSSAFSYGSKLTSAQMQNLRDNLPALANGDSGAPELQLKAMSDLGLSYIHYNTQISWEDQIWTTKLNLGVIIGDNPDLMRLHLKMKRSGGFTASVRFVLGGLTSSAAELSTGSYDTGYWKYTGTIDVSSFAPGGYDIQVQCKQTDAGSSSMYYIIFVHEHS
jgi:hypothetical protein